jgi:hypothetical protein
MKPLLALFLILTVGLLASAETVSPVATAALTPTEMSAATGAGFWGGVLCGAAVAGVGVGLVAATAATGGAAAIWAIAIGTSVAGHVALGCAMID